MVKTNGHELKSKEVASSSRKRKVNVGRSKNLKRARNSPIIESSDEEDSNFEPMVEENQDSEDDQEEEGEEGDDGSEMEWSEDGLPKWRKTKKLSEYELQYRMKMYEKKMKKSTQKLIDLCLRERMYDQEVIAPFGVMECFRRLGWLDFLQFKGSDVIYPDQILEWMTSLRKDEGKKPPVTTKLIGNVGSKEVVLSFDALKNLTRYDVKSTIDGPYEYPPDKVIDGSEVEKKEWKNWVETVFEIPSGIDVTKWKLKRDNLKAFPMLLLRFVTTNVMPRTSDLNKVRHFEVMILYALMTGSRKLSARHLIMYNIWEAREVKERFAVPHTRLLSKLLLKQGAIPEEVMGEYRPHKPIKIPTFVKSSIWRYEKTRTKHRLYFDRDRGKSVEGPRSDAEEEEEVAVEVSMGSDVTPPVLIGIPPEMFGTPYYTYVHDTMSKARPTDFSDLPRGFQLLIDMQSQRMAEARAFEQSMIYRVEYFRNLDWKHRDDIRRDQDYARGHMAAVRPRPIDWQNSVMDPYSVTRQLPRYPQATPSEYISPYPTQQGQGSSSSVFAGAYDAEAIQRNLWELRLGRRPYMQPEYDG